MRERALPHGGKRDGCRKTGVNCRKCIGCGACATGCPTEAISMERVADVPEPPENYMDLGLRLLQEKGALEKFIEINTPQKLD